MFIQPLRALRRAGLGVEGSVEGKSVEVICGYVRRGSEERVRLLPNRPGGVREAVE